MKKAQVVALAPDKRWAPAKTVVSILVAGLCVASVTFALDRSRAPVGAPAATPRFGYGPARFAEAVSKANGQVALGEERIGRHPEQWAYQESYARAMMGRARLTGSFDDLAAARTALSRGLRDAPVGAGPLLTDAVNNMTIHRLAPINASLTLFEKAAVPLDPGDRAEAEALHGDVAFYSGRYQVALDMYRGAARLDNSPGIAVRLANWYKKAGQYDAAIKQLDTALARVKVPTPQFYANILLQKGIAELDRGNWTLARDLFSQADRTFPGYWLIEAHVAQMTAIAGDLDGAERQYKRIASRASASIAMPEVMDALAALYRAKGDMQNSRLWADRAGKIWDRRLSQLPEASYGHALEHELVLGSPARALELAYHNRIARPYGDSDIMLGWALLANGRPEEAVKIITQLGQTGWRTAQQYVVLTQAREMQGRAAESDAARAQALAINPRAFDPAAALIWFGNH